MPLEAIEEEISALAPLGFTCAYHLRFSRPLRHVITYPTRWIETYTRETLVACDPVAIWGISSTGIIRWSDLEGKSPDPLRVFEKARAHGLPFGAGIACGPAHSRTICGAARGDRNHTDAELSRLQALVHHAHDLLEQRFSLRPILLGALDAIACGMTYNQAAEHLGISRTALRYRLTTAQRTLGATDTQDAVRRAIDAGLISSNRATGLSAGLPAAPAGFAGRVSASTDDDAASASP